MQGFGFFTFQAIVIHLIFLYSIFDIYFTSPLTHGMPGHKPSLSAPPAKRLVLFVADGLRADKCFESKSDGLPFAPFLRNRAVNEQWAVSHTRVPTESRPGHVAIMAGFYEDVSAITKGWKENPVEFDSVFNQSHKVFSWGSPDIVLMFSKDLPETKVYTDTYPAEYEDFAGADLSALDTWVFNKVIEFFRNASRDPSLHSEISQPQNIFFLHLLGIDTNGHRHNPSSKLYMDNIELVDSGIENITRLIDEYFGDNSTAYIVTSDHGMSEWGTHGSGHPHETLTPLIAWGAGIAKASVDESLEDWGFESARRKDISQADIAPLMSSLLGLHYPVNSVGVLNPDLLSVSNRDKAEMVYSNMLAIIEQFKASMKAKEETTLAFVFRSYPHLSPSLAEDYKRKSRVLIQDGRYADAISECTRVMKVALDGVEYYHSYDRFFLGGCIAVGFLAWMGYTVLYMCQEMQTKSIFVPKDHNSYLFWMLRVCLTCGLKVMGLPWTHILYALTPTFPLERIFSYRHVFQEQLTGFHRRGSVTIYLVVFAGSELLVLGFFHRSALTFLMLLLVIHRFVDPCSQNSLRWICSCLLLAVFPLLPVVGRGTLYPVVYAAGGIALLAASLRMAKVDSNLAIIQSFCLAASLLTVIATSMSISMGNGLPLICQITSWVLLGSTFILPLFGPSSHRARLTSISTSLFTLYLLLSTSYEPLFLMSLSVFIYTWIDTNSTKSQKGMSSDISMKTEQGGISGQVYHSFIYLILITFAFFGTGNIASINSFELASVHCFVTVFKPFFMASLLLLKIVIPILLVACGHQCILAQAQYNSRIQFLIVLVMSDILGLNFFMLIRNTGSWLDIGTSISHYVICLSTTIVSLLLNQLSYYLINARIFSKSSKAL